jgi:hypothetical protein
MVQRDRINKTPTPYRPAGARELQTAGIKEFVDSSPVVK